MNELTIINISGIDCYEKDGVAYLKLETVARGLGFTEIAASGNECVRWRTVKKYLSELGIATSCDGDLPEFIPENIFYRLAMKAKNEAAEAFQAKIADDVIPTIRKTGGYNQTPLSLVEMFAMQAQINLESERKLHALEGKLDDTNKRFEAVTTFVTSPLTEVDTWQERMTRHIRRAVEEFGLNYQKFHAQLYEELERAAGVDLQVRQTRLRKRMMDSGATKTECKNVSKLSIVAADKKLRAMFETLLRNEIVRLAASSSVNA